MKLAIVGLLALASCSPIVAIPLMTMSLTATTQALATTAGPHLIPASTTAEESLPDGVLGFYVEASTHCQGLPWQVVAAIAAVESNHGRHGGATLGASGIVQPAIIGVALDGTNGNRRILDTDGGQLDGDPVLDRAVGPFQFLPTTWRAHAPASWSPHHFGQAATIAAQYLCEPSGEMGEIGAAIFRYNNSSAYVAHVLAMAQSYAADPAAISDWFATLGWEPAIGAPDSGYPNGPTDADTTGTDLGGDGEPTAAVDDWALPMRNISRAAMRRTHHTYPAWDFGAPAGTPVYAMASGTVSHASSNDAIRADTSGMRLGRCGGEVTITTTEGASITVCHLQATSVTTGEAVQAGQQIGRSGGEPGTPGAGNTTGAHLHLSIRYEGALRCPQKQLEAIADGAPLASADLATSGCVHRW